MLRYRPSSIAEPWLFRSLALCAWLLLGVTMIRWWAPAWGLAEPVGTASRAESPPVPTIPCLSYAPFRRPGHTPFDPTLRLDDAQLREDLNLLKAWTPCIRLYGMGHGQERIPALAEEVGLQVVVGAWISRDREASRQELEAALAAAHAHPKVVRMIIVGNEVLLRQERSPEELAALIREARSRSPVPVAYADVWEFWLRHARILAPEVDVVAVHVLPYWEDHPIARVHAVDHVVSIVQQVRLQLDHRPVWLAETGWPAAGRQRGPAVPGPREQALFVRELRHRLAAEQIDYNLIEGFDQPWKRWLEGAMGGAWGILTAQGLPRDAKAQALPVDPTARGALMGAVLSGAGGLMLLSWWRRRHHRPPIGGDPSGWRTLGGAGLMGLMGLFWGAHLGQLAHWPRNLAEWAVALALLASALVVMGGAAWQAAQAIAAAPGSRGNEAAGRGWSRSVTVFLFLAAWQALQLVFDGRYRALPWEQVAAPGVALVMARASGLALHFRPRDRLLASVLGAAALVLPIFEGLANTRALALSGCWLVWALLVWTGPGLAADARASRTGPARGAHG